MEGRWWSGKGLELIIYTIYQMTKMYSSPRIPTVLVNIISAPGFYVHHIAWNKSVSWNSFGLSTLMFDKGLHELWKKRNI